MRLLEIGAEGNDPGWNISEQSQSEQSMREGGLRSKPLR